MIVRELLTRLGFQVDETGAKQYEKSMDGIKRHAATLQRNLGGILGTIGVGMGFAFFKDITSRFTDLESRLANNLGADNAAEAMKRLNNVALLTYQDTEQVIEGFISMKSSLDALGLSTDQQIDLQQSLADGMTATGIKGQNAARVQMWLNRAFAKGKMGAEEFNGVLEAGGDDIIALWESQLGIATGQLRQMATQGKITGDVISKFLLGNMDRWRKQSEDMPVTINDALARIQSKFAWFVYEQDKATGVSAFMAQALLKVSDHIEILAGVVAGLMIPALMGLVVWVASTTTAFIGLAAALLANPITWVVIGLAALALAIQDVYMWITGGKSVIGSWLGPWEDVVAKATAAWERFTAPFKEFWSNLKTLMQAPDATTAFAALCDTLGSLWNALWTISLPGVIAAAIPGFFDPLKQAWDSVVTYLSSVWDEFWNGLKSGITSLPGEVASGVKGAWNKFWGSNTSPEANALPGRATGGPVVRGKAYMVGEEGPEKFVPGQSGWILPHGFDKALAGLSGGLRAPTVNSQSIQIGDIAVNLDMPLPPGSSPQQGQDIAEQVAARVQHELRRVIDSTLATFPRTV